MTKKEYIKQRAEKDTGYEVDEITLVPHGTAYVTFKSSDILKVYGPKSEVMEKANEMEDE